MSSMQLISLNRIDVPTHLASIQRIAANELPAQDTELGQAARDSIWSAVEELYRSGIFPAITFCLRHRGQIVLNRSLGYARGYGPHEGSASSAVLASPESPICLFSASKVVTAMLVHWLNQEHLIDLTDPISRYIPEYGVHGKQNATIYHLLTHRGGIPRLEGDVDPELLFDEAAVVAMLCAAKPVSRSGRRVAYHAITAGYILGELIRRVTGASPRDILDQVICKPMNMRNFNYGLRQEDRDHVIDNHATGIKPVFPVDSYLHNILGGSLELAVNLCNDPRFMDVIVPAGNIYASAEETSRFFEMLRQEGRYGDQQIFKPETVRRAILEAQRPELDASLLMPMRYSMGFMLGSKPIGLYGPNTSRAFGHLGFTNIFCWADPARDTSVAIMTSGKALLGPHLLPLGRLLFTLSSRCH